MVISRVVIGATSRSVPSQRRSEEAILSFRVFTGSLRSGAAFSFGRRKALIAPSECSELGKLTR